MNTVIYDVHMWITIRTAGRVRYLHRIYISKFCIHVSYTILVLYDTDIYKCD